MSTLRINQPALLADQSLGGGPMIPDEVIPAQEGNVFDKLTRRARSGGQVSLRELFVVNWTSGNEKALDCGFAVSEPPSAAGVEVVVFEVPGKEWTYRPEAVAYLEAYTVPGLEMDWRIFGSHLKDGLTLRLWGLLSSRPPGIGDTIFVLDEGVGTEFEQPFRVDAVQVDQAIYNEGGENEVPYLDVLIELSAALQRDVNGTTTPGHSLSTTTIKVRAGQVAPNAKFHGVGTLTADLAADQVDIQIDSVFAPVVPASRTSSPIIDAPALPQVIRHVVSGVGHEYTDNAAPAHTTSRLIDASNQALSIVFSLSPLPTFGSVTVEFVSLGKWYTLTDDGTGQIGGTGLGGSGTVSDQTGTLSVALEFLPDLDTYILVSWGSWQQWTRIDGLTLPAAEVLASIGIGAEPGTLTLGWQAGGVSKSATDDGTGALSGDASGSYIYSGGQLRMAPSALPDGDISYTLTQGAAAFSGPATGITISGGRVNWTTAQALPIAPGSAQVSMLVSYLWPDGATRNQTTHTWVDQGDGTLRPLPGLFQAVPGSNITLDYATGQYSAPEIIADFTHAIRGVAGGFDSQNVTSRYFVGGAITVNHSKLGGADVISGTLAAGSYALSVALPPGDPAVLGSLLMTLGSRSYDGGAGELAVQDDAILINSWTGGDANNPALQAGLTRGGDWQLETMAWRTLGMPVQASSLSVRGTAVSGAVLNASADDLGVYGGDATGTADYETGVSVMTWSEPIDPGTLTHSGIIITLTPLNADLIGIDSSRLPPDGRVPKFHPGGQLAVSDKSELTLPDPLSAGQLVSLGQTDLGTVVVVDQAGTRVDEALWTADLLAGNLLMATPLDLSAYTQPLKAMLYWDDETGIAAVQANGIITLAAPLPRVYSAGARAFSILEFGDLQARATVFFDQKTWDGVFSDTVNGDPAAFTYNLAGFPVEVDNDKAPTQRWVLHFLNTTTIEVIGESIGNLGQFPIASDIAPIDPATGQAVFILRAGGWGGGPIPGNALRINIITAAAHAWALRCTSLNTANVGTDQAVFEPRGEA